MRFRVPGLAGGSVRGTAQVSVHREEPGAEDGTDAGRTAEVAVAVWPDTHDDLDARLLPAAVSPLVAGAVAAPPRPCTVLAAFPTCLYVSLGATSVAHDRVLGVLAVLASDALELPIGLRLALPSSEVEWGVRGGQEVVVGGGRVRLPVADVVAARISRPARVRPAARVPVRSQHLSDAGVLGELAHDLALRGLAGSPVGHPLRGLVGAGRGLTPSGDDALCGVLLALSAVDAAVATRARTAIRAALDPLLARTTSLSASLLVAAADGYAVPSVARLVRLVASGSASEPEVHAALEPVLAIGHTSGADLVAGLAGALRALDSLLPPTTSVEPATAEATADPATSTTTADALPASDPEEGPRRDRPRRD